jgi:hypothetical protein
VVIAAVAGVDRRVDIEAGQQIWDVANAAVAPVDYDAHIGSAGAGDLLTAANQAAAQTLIANTIGTIVTNGLSSIGGQIESLKNASAALLNSIQVQDDAANGYLNTNYEDDSNNFKESVARIKGAIATVVLADKLTEQTSRLLE